MGLFGRKKPKPPELPLDPCMGDAPARALRGAARRGDWKAVRDFLVSVDHPDDKTFYLDVATDLDGPQPWIEQWAAAEPNSALALLTRGSHGVRWAWEARSAKQAKYVSDDQFQVFFDRLRAAENHLDEATELDPDDPTGWGLLITCGIGRQVGHAETLRRFKEVTARYQWHQKAHERMLQQLCHKWGGSHEAMHDFAHHAVVEMPGGCALGKLVATAHFEHWYSLPEGDDANYVANPAVAASLAAAADKSIRHAHYVMRPGWPNVHGVFAYMFALTEQWQAAAEQFHIIGDLVTDFPWGYFNASSAKFQRVRQEAYAKVGR